MERKAKAPSLSLKFPMSTSELAKTDPRHPSGLKAVAIFELSKALAGLLAGVGFLIKIGDAPGTAALALVNRIEAALPLPEATFRFLQGFDRGDQAIAGVVLLAYAALHLVEGIGLWKDRVWAEWLVVITGGVYVPFELYAAVHRPNSITISLLLINIAVVIYLIFVLKAARKTRRERELEQLRGASSMRSNP